MAEHSKVFFVTVQLIENIGLVTFNNNFVQISIMRLHNAYTHRFSLDPSTISQTLFKAQATT